MVKKELDNLKYKIYKKSWLSDYLTFKQLIKMWQTPFENYKKEIKKKEQKKKKKTWKRQKNNYIYVVFNARK